MNDSLKADEINELEQIAEWLDGLYIRLQGAEIMFATKTGNEQYCESLQDEIERAVQAGIALNRPMENCGCLFESLNGDCDPMEFMMRARAELNALAMAIRQIAIDGHRVEEEKCKYPGLKEMYRDAQEDTQLSKAEKTYRKVAERYWKKLDTNDRPKVDQLKRWLERPGNH